MRSSQKITFLTFFSALILSGVFLFYFPTLDFDEALYRRVVETMKAAHDPWLLSWDGNTLFHKPPIFYWLVWFFSWLVDGRGAYVSSFAARCPSFFSTIGILICLYRAGNRFGSEKENSVGKNAALAFLCGLFPMLTANAVIFDPLQTLMLMPALVVPTLLFFDETKVKSRDWIFWSLSLFAASAVKGLNGLIIPTIAFGLHLIFSLQTHGFKKLLNWKLKFLGFVFFPACVLIFLFYFLLNEKIGPSFTHEFIWVQHFERGTTPMEQHSGSFFYQFLVVLLGGGVLTSIFLNRISLVRNHFSNLGFPLTYVFSFCLIFGISATKLPHYSWPAWPAIALFLGMTHSLLSTPEQTAHPTTVKALSVFSRCSLILVGCFSFALALAPETILGLFSKNQSFVGVIHYFEGFNFGERLALIAASALSFSFEYRKQKLISHFETSALISIGIALGLSAGFTRTLNHLMVRPFYQVSEDIKKDGATSADCIRYSGALSPTLSLALAPELIHNRCEPETMRYLIAPEWKAKECAERNFKVIQKESYLIVCKKG